MTEEHDGHFETLLEFLQRERGFDFTGYKRPSLVRRVMRRMQTVGIDDFEELGLSLEPPVRSDDPLGRFWQWMERDANDVEPSRVRGFLQQKLSG